VFAQLVHEFLGVPSLGAALYEEYVYGKDGSFLSGSFADYLVPTAMEVPEPTILHRESPSPFTPLGAKGVGEGNCMSTPVCIANAIADALALDKIELPATPAKLGFRLIKSTIRERRQGRLKPNNFARACHSGLRCA
jgi:2-furoyl-CoA dehydrogenase large subunit